jgi:3-deoxy-D-manno-octulosonate 8-phosphate phosphatase (KDO 8-P phosphatase)
MDAQPSTEERLAAIRLLAMDVDGVLTNGSILLTADGEENKQFHVADGLGIRLALEAGLVVAWISSRTSAVVAQRAAELKISHLYQNVANKSKALAELIGAYTLQTHNVAYIGDDLNDLPAYSLAGVKFAPANAVNEIKGIADFVTEKRGGEGAVREVCDVLLKAQGKWNDAVTRYLAHLLQAEDTSLQQDAM